MSKKAQKSAQKTAHEQKPESQKEDSAASEATSRVPPSAGAARAKHHPAVRVSMASLPGPALRIQLVFEKGLSDTEKEDARQTALLEHKGYLEGMVNVKELHEDLPDGSLREKWFYARPEMVEKLKLDDLY